MFVTCLERALDLRAHEMGPLIGKGNAEDATLLSLWARGDRTAAQRLLARYEPEVSRFFRKRQAQDADDLTQETLLAIIEAPVRFRGEASFRTYLLRIARFKLWSHRRRRREQYVALDDVESDLLEAAVSEISPHERGLERTLQSLAPSLSRVIRLTLEQDLTREAIASELGIPAGTVASRIRLAKTQLKAMLSLADA
jgi:RNA polymerase sigma-70 factor (ECF subfamily)